MLTSYAAAAAHRTLLLRSKMAENTGFEEVSTQNLLFSRAFIVFIKKRLVLRNVSCINACTGIVFLADTSLVETFNSKQF